MDYRAMAQRALDQRAEIFERRKALNADPSVGADAKRSAFAEMDRQMDQLAADAREAVEMGKTEDEIRKGLESPEARTLNGATARGGARIEVRHGEAMPEGSSFRDLLPDGKAATDAEFGEYVRAMVRGETRADNAEGTDNLGGYLVAPRYAARILDLARNKAQVIRAGASVVPMGSNEEKVAKVASDPVPAWRNESAAISTSGITFGQVDLKAKSLAVLCKASFELVEDAANFGSTLRNSLAQAFALTLDSAALTGTGTDPEPLGLLNAGIHEITSTDVGAPTSWDDFIAGVAYVRGKNYSPSGILLPETDEAALASLTDSQGNYMRSPEYVSNVPRYTTGNMPAAAASGEGAVFGDWQHLMIGVRTQFELKVLNERYADTGEIGFIGWLRADVQVAQSNAFAMIRRAAS